MEYVFCEFCQSEVESNDAYLADFEWYCTKCFDRLKVKKDKEKGLQRNLTEYNGDIRYRNTQN